MCVVLPVGEIAAAFGEERRSQGSLSIPLCVMVNKLAWLQIIANILFTGDIYIYFYILSVQYFLAGLFEATHCNR